MEPKKKCLKFYIGNPFKIESDQTKSSPKNWTHLQFYIRDPFKKFSDQKKINPEIRPQNYPLGPTSWVPFFRKLSPTGCFWKFLKISSNSPKYNTHKKIVLHFFIPMLLLPITPPLTYLKLKKNKGLKVDHFTHSLTSLHSLHN